MFAENEIHKGHRERMQEKLFSESFALSDHELLEILLYGCIPRQDTNPLAHELLQVFGSLQGVFKASEVDLLQINGVGKKVADHIRLMGKLSEVLGERIIYDKRPPYGNSGQTVSQLREYFTDAPCEKFVVVFLDKERKQIFRLDFKSGAFDKVFTDNSEIAHAIALHKPAYIVLAHNHPSGNPYPSDLDDTSTMKFLALCDLHGTELSDHVIFTENSYYSYFESGKMDEIKSKYSKI